jgi:phosphoribosylformylglycinamidine cyclo-ligase
MAVVVSKEDAEKAMEAFKAQGETVYLIGEITDLPEGEAPCVVR